MTANHTRREKRGQNHISDTYDVNDSFELRAKRARAENDAFRAAMLTAIGQGKERVKEGVKTADPDINTVPRSPARFPTYVATASSISDL